MLGFGVEGAGGADQAEGGEEEEVEPACGAALAEGVPVADGEGEEEGWGEEGEFGGGEVAVRSEGGHDDVAV